MRVFYFVWKRLEGDDADVWCTAFLTAAGYASANVQYGFGDPEFVHNGYTVAAFEVRAHFPH